jgi:hypothetical protein
MFTSLQILLTVA